MGVRAYTALLALVVLAQTARTEEQRLIAHPDDVEVGLSNSPMPTLPLEGGGLLGNETLPSIPVGNTGVYNESGDLTCMVIPFAIPNLGRRENPFKSATFRVTQAAGMNPFPQLRIDLYGFGPRKSSYAEESDFFAGEADTRNGTVHLKRNLIEINTQDAPDAGTTYELEGAELVDFLNRIYGKGENVGQFFFLRLSPSALPQDHFKFIPLNSAQAASGGPEIVYSSAP